MYMYTKINIAIMKKLPYPDTAPRYYAALQLLLATWSHYASHATYLRRR